LLVKLEEVTKKLSELTFNELNDQKFNEFIQDLQNTLTNFKFKDLECWDYQEQQYILISFLIKY